MKKKKEILQYIATKVAWLVILALGKSAQLEIRNKHYYHQAKNSGKPILVLAWHGKMLAPIYVMRNEGLAAMVSEHGDGEIIAQTILKLGYKTVRGSSTRGGHKAFREMLKLLKAGHPCTVLPDGPTGPRQVLKMGSVLLAQRSGGLIVPITFATKKPIVMNSWDRFTLWKPFSKVIVGFGKPLHIPRKLAPAQLEDQRLFIEQHMNNLQKELDENFRA